MTTNDFQIQGVMNTLDAYDNRITDAENEVAAASTVADAAIAAAGKAQDSADNIADALKPPALLPAGDRSAQYILDHGILLSECTEEELNNVVEYKVALKARDSAYDATQNALTDANIAITENAATAANTFAKQLQQLTDDAIARYKNTLKRLGDA